MAYINDIYIFVEDESVSRDVEITSHSVESGIDMTDHVKKNAYTASLSGKIVGDDSPEVQLKLANLMNNGTIVNYSGRNILKNVQITSFKTSHPNKIWGGCSFSMELKQTRIARVNFKNQNPSIAKTQKGGTQQIEKVNSETAVYHTVKKGDTVYGLVSSFNAPYKSLGKSCDWIMQNNPNAFYEKNNFGSLIVGSKLLVGFKV